MGKVRLKEALKNCKSGQYVKRRNGSWSEYFVQFGRYHDTGMLAETYKLNRDSVHIKLRYIPPPVEEQLKQIEIARKTKIG